MTEEYGPSAQIDLDRDKPFSFTWNGTIFRLVYVYQIIYKNVQLKFSILYSLFSTWTKLQVIIFMYIYVTSWYFF